MDTSIAQGPRAAGGKSFVCLDPPTCGWLNHLPCPGIARSRPRSPPSSEASAKTSNLSAGSPESNSRLATTEAPSRSAARIPLPSLDTQRYRSDEPQEEYTHIIAGVDPTPQESRVSLASAPDIMPQPIV